MVHLTVALRVQSAPKWSKRPLAIDAHGRTRTCTLTPAVKVMAGKLLSSVKTLVRLVCATFFAYVFVFSGLAVGVLSILLLVVWPISKSAYRWITSGLAYTVLGRKQRGEKLIMNTELFSLH